MEKSHLLNQSKQELMQADAKLGMLATFHVLVITSFIVLATSTTWNCSDWLFLGTIPPFIGLLFIIWGLTPRNVKQQQSIKDVPTNPFNYPDNAQEIFSKELHKDISFAPVPGDVDYKATIAVNQSLACFKYKMCKYSLMYILWLPSAIAGIINCMKK